MGNFENKNIFIILKKCEERFDENFFVKKSEISCGC